MTGKKKERQRMLAAALALCTCASSFGALTASAAYGVGGNGKAVMEYLDRGIYAVNSGNGMFVSWRWNADDADNAEFRLYRDGTLIYTSTDGATSYLDKGGSASSVYRVDTLENGQVKSSDTCKFNSNSNYFDIPLNSPGSIYSPNDCCVGDVDGDGQYEIFVKWDPSDSQDNSISGYTSNVYIDCVTLTGKTLWRIDLGKNIRAGQHYTQMCVADFDGDGFAELITKTADGTKDSTGKVIGDSSKDYRNSSGYVLDGPEYLTLFDGLTGAALDTIDFPVPRGSVSAWGDNYGNRVDRFNSGIAYLDGVHPSAIYNRGYYTRMTISAIDVVNGKLSVRWIFDSNNSGSSAAAGQGNHNLMVGDVDNDGKQEISMGDCVIDDNGKLLWASGKGHGDAQHLGDFVPDRPGLELWECHESGNYGVTLFDAATGTVIFHKDGDKDTGRCAADNIYAGNAGAEFWGARPANTVMDSKGNQIGSKAPAMNFLIYWDGDLERELLDGVTITKMTNLSTITTLFTASGCESNNSTKAVPCLTADLFGDWREELILRKSSNDGLRIYCTTSETKVRLTTLMHDMQYRCQAACEQSSYNQPPHASYYLGSDVALPARPQVLMNNVPEEPVSGKYIGNLTVSDTSNMRDWLLNENAAVGSQIYGDRDFTYTALPAELVGAEAIMTACDSKAATGDVAAFTALQDMTAYVLLDTRVTTTPAWLSSWTKTTLTASASNDVNYVIYTRDFSAGDTVTLGENGQTASCVNYTFFAAAKQSALIGDVNLDGSVTLADAIALRQFLITEKTLTESQAAQGDINGDGRLSAVDLTLLKRILLSS